MPKGTTATRRLSPHAVRFPGESARYRSARNALLENEIKLRRQIEAVAAERRRLPLGGELREDYVFDDIGSDTGTTRPVKFSELFADGKDTLLVYSFMFGPRMGSACSSCTSILDGLDGQALHVSQKVNLAVVARSPADRIRQFANGRGWHRLHLLSSARNSYNRDYHGEDATGAQQPTMNVFTRKTGRIYHTWSSELLFVPHDRGQDGRHVDLFWPLWNLLDLTPAGRDATWHPKLSYDSGS